jgi:hypothetical protein
MIRKEKALKMDIKKELEIRERTYSLEEFYPIEAAYNSRCTLYQRALDDGRITKEEFVEAAKYYGRLWNYVGD